MSAYEPMPRRYALRMWAAEILGAAGIAAVLYLVGRITNT